MTQETRTKLWIGVGASILLGSSAAWADHHGDGDDMHKDDAAYEQSHGGEGGEGGEAGHGGEGGEHGHGGEGG
ncbi:hypothetical protein TW86_19160, partial [Halomonas sp. S2151]